MLQPYLHSRVFRMLAPCCIALVLIASSSGMQEGKEENARDINLEISVVLDSRSITLTFTIANNGKTDFETTPIGTNYNRLVIVDDKGNEKEEYAWKNKISPVIIKPGSKETWKIDDISRNLFLAPLLNRQGTYRLYWKVGDLKSAPINLVREKDAEEKK